MNVPGWSWCIDILPFMENKPLHGSLDLQNDSLFAGSPATAIAMKTSVKELRCPSFSGTRWVDPTRQYECITNYKALGATHWQSLAQATPNTLGTLPLYNEGFHPDGGCYPGASHGVDKFGKDGTAHTAIVVETVEQYYSRWIVGTEACLVGLPSRQPAGAGGAPVVFADPPGNGLTYACPDGYQTSPGAFWDKSSVNDNYTYLSWDYVTDPYVNPPDLVAADPPSFSASWPSHPTEIQIGPSSHHYSVINHLLADGSAQSVNEDIDAAAYMFLITREGGDPSTGLR